jgi:hypothetical protein
MKKRNAYKILVKHEGKRHLEIWKKKTVFGGVAWPGST